MDNENISLFLPTTPEKISEGKKTLISAFVQF